MPSVQRKDIDNTSAVVTVTLTKEDLKPKIDSELKHIRNNGNFKGFRQGHVPMDHVKRMYGTAVFSEALNKMLSEELYNYLRDSKLNVLGQPLPTENQKKYSFKVDKMENEYAIEYEVGFVPDYEIQGLDKKQSFERLTISDLDSLAEKDLEYARRRMGKRSNPEDDIQEKDIVKIASKELDGDQLKPDGWETTITVLVESITDDALKNELLGLKKGDTLRFNSRLLEMGDDEAKFRKYILNLPEDDDRSVGDWFEGQIEEVSRLEIADMDEEFYSNYFGGGVSTQDEAMDKLKSGIQGFYDIRSNALLMRDFQKRLLELNKFDLPAKFLKRWLQVNNEELTPEKIDADYEAFAENLRWSIMRDRLKDQFQIEIPEEEIRAEYVRKVRNYFQAELPEHIIASSVERLMEDKDDVEKTTRDLENDRIFVHIRELVTIKDKAVPSEEFHAILDEITKKAEQEQNADADLRETVDEV